MSFANRRNAATSLSGILTSCSPTPGTGLRVHRGTVIIPVMLHLPRRVSPPPRAWRDILSLHEEGVGGEGRAVTHGYIVEDECTHPDRAARANRGPVAFERAVLQRMALDLAPEVEDGLVTDGGERRVFEGGTAVEDPPADPHAHQPVEHALERRAIERVEIVNRMHLPQALGRPEIRVVDGTDRRPHGMQRLDAAVHQGEVDCGDHDAER